MKACPRCHQKFPRREMRGSLCVECRAQTLRHTDLDQLQSDLDYAHSPSGLSESPLYPRLTNLIAQHQWLRSQHSLLRARYRKLRQERDDLKASLLAPVPLTFPPISELAERVRSGYYQTILDARFKHDVMGSLGIPPEKRDLAWTYACSTTDRDRRTPWVLLTALRGLAPLLKND